MAVFRVEKNENFTVMSNYHLRDKTIPLKAKGLLCYMLSLPDDWDYTLNGLASQHPDGKDAVRSAVNLLEKKGYLTRKQTFDKDGRFSHNEYTVYEFPQKDNPLLGKPLSENPTTENPTAVNPMAKKPSTENPTQLNTYLPNTKEQNTYSTNNLPTNQGWSGGCRRDCVEHLKEKFEYDLLCYNIAPEKLDEIILIMAEVLCSTKPTFKIEGEWISRKDVVTRLEMIDEGHIEYIFDYLERKKPKISNNKAYYLSMLYNAPIKMDSYITGNLREWEVI